MSEVNPHGGDDKAGPKEMVNLQDIITERKAERKLKAEQKRQFDLERIRKMKSTTGIDPLQRFPKEIWVKIFDELDPEDRWNAWQVHPVFRDLLESNRIRDILFPEMLKIKEFRVIVQRSFGSVWDEGIRCISKTARKSFDVLMGGVLIKLFQDNLYSLSDSCTFLYPEVVSLRLEIRQERRLITKLLESFDDGSEHSAKRFFPKAFTIIISDEHLQYNDPGEEDLSVLQLFNQFKKNITALLERIGNQIWFLKLDFRDLDDAPLSFCDAYTLVRSWISLMPNLKALELSIQSYLRICREDEEENWPIVQRTLQNCPFPHLSDLERLDFLYCHQPKESVSFINIYSVILQANRHIKILSISEGVMNVNGGSLMSSYLTQPLHLTGFSAYEPDDFDELTSLQQIVPIVNTNWPLKYIRLGLRKEPINAVFRFLENFLTLETVKLSRLKDPIIGNTGYLKLPNLVDFHMAFENPKINYQRNIHFFFSLQFLLHSKKLKTLYWEMNALENAERLRKHLKNKENENQSKMLDFRGGMRFLFESNIWDVFPSLEVVKVQNWKAECRDECKHKYFRTARDQCRTLKEFSKIHGCSRNKKLHSCTMLVELWKTSI